MLLLLPLLLPELLLVQWLLLLLLLVLRLMLLLLRELLLQLAAEPSPVSFGPAFRFAIVFFTSVELHEYIMGVRLDVPSPAGKMAHCCHAIDQATGRVISLCG